MGISRASFARYSLLDCEAKRGGAPSPLGVLRTFSYGVRSLAGALPTRRLRGGRGGPPLLWGFYAPFSHGAHSLDVRETSLSSLGRFHVPFRTVFTPIRGFYVLFSHGAHSLIVGGPPLGGVRVPSFAQCSLFGWGFANLCGSPSQATGVSIDGDHPPSDYWSGSHIGRSAWRTRGPGRSSSRAARPPGLLARGGPLTSAYHVHLCRVYIYARDPSPPVGPPPRRASPGIGSGRGHHPHHDIRAAPTRSGSP